MNRNQNRPILGAILAILVSFTALSVLRTVRTTVFSSLENENCGEIRERQKGFFLENLRRCTTIATAIVISNLKVCDYNHCYYTITAQWD